jgi:hypothetical protein
VSVDLPPFFSVLVGVGAGSVKLGECHGLKVRKWCGTGHGVGGNLAGSWAKTAVANRLQIVAG